jgi:hypothetical protein
VSAHGRRRLGPERAGRAQLGWALLAVAAALIGGLAAAALVHASLTIAVIVSLVVGVIAALVVFWSPARPPEPESGEPQDADFGRYPATARRAAPPLSRDPRAASPASFAPPAPAPPASDPVAPGPAARSETAVQLLPLPPQPGGAGPPPDAPWWDSAQGAPAPSAGAKRAPAPDLSTYLASTFIAQCPRCGAFRLDIGRARSGWDFRCESCEYTWTWQPGTPWPPVRVMPRERRE